MKQHVVRSTLPFVLQAFSVGCFELGALPTTNTYDAGQGVYVDGGQQGLSDAGLAEEHSDAGAASAAVACDVAHPCASDELCASDGLCTDKCSANGACIVASSATGFGHMVADGSTLYYTTDPSRDPNGNPRRDGALWKLSVSGEVSRLATVEDAPVLNLQQRGAYLYWIAAGQIWRAPKDGSLSPQALYPAVIGASVVGDTELAVVNVVGSQDCTIAMGTLDGARALERPIALVGYRACSSILLAAGSAYHFNNDGEVMSIDLKTGQSKNTQLRADNVFAVVPPKLYFRTTSGPHVPQRADLDNPTRAAEIVYRPPADLQQTSSAYPLVQADWLYLLTTHDAPATRIQVVRASLTALGTSETLLSRTFAPPRDFAFEERFAVTDRNLFVAARSGRYGDASSRGLLYAVPVPQH